MSAYSFMSRKNKVLICIRCLLTDPKSRKMIIVEQPLLPLYVKDMIASVLFENLQVSEFEDRTISYAYNLS